MEADYKPFRRLEKRDHARIKLFANAEQAVRTFYPGTADILSATPVVVRGSEQVSGIDIAIQTSATYRISGEIHTTIPIRPTQPPGQFPGITASVGFALRDLSVPDDAGGTNIGSITLRPSGDGASGRFEVTGVLPGSYDWRAWISESSADGGMQLATAIVPVEVRNWDVTGLVLVIHPTVPVKGVVSIDGHAHGQNKVRCHIPFPIRGCWTLGQCKYGRNPSDFNRRPVMVAVVGDVTADHRYALARGCRLR